MNAQLKESIMQIVNASRGVQKTATDKVDVYNAQEAKHKREVDAKSAPAASGIPTNTNAGKPNAGVDKAPANKNDGIVKEDGGSINATPGGATPKGGAEAASNQGIEDSPYTAPVITGLSAATGGAGAYGLASALGGSESTKVLSTIAGMFGGGAAGHVMAKYLLNHPELKGGRDTHLNVGGTPGAGIPAK